MKARRLELPYDMDIARNRFLAGFVLTFFVVLLVPLIAESLLQPILSGIIGANNVALLSSSIIVTLLMWLSVTVMKMAGSGSRIYKNLGIPGILGLLCAYWFIGDLWRATIPIVSIIIALAWKEKETFLEGYRD